MAPVSDKSIKYGLFAASFCGSALSGYYLWKWMQSNTAEIQTDPVSHNPQIEVLYTFNASQCDEWCASIKQSSSTTLIGLDCEWKPPQKKKERNKLAVIQICTFSKCFIFQCIDWDELPCNLTAILHDAQIIKTGVGIHGDAKVIRRSFGVQMVSYLDVRYLAVTLYDRDIFRVPTKCFALKSMTTFLFGVEIPTSSTRSDWEQKPLTDSQQLYGALDCYYSRCTALLLLHCLKNGRMIHHGTEDILGALHRIDSVEILSSLFRPLRHLMNSGFRQPSWLRPNVSVTAKNEKNEKGRNDNVSSESMVTLEQQWLGLHSKKYAKRRAHLDFWNMYGADGRFVARVKRRRVEWYVERKLAVIVDDSPSKDSGHLPSFQLVFRLKRYRFPGGSAYVMKSCFVCGSTGTDGKHLFKHMIVPTSYRKWLAKTLRDALSHEIVPLCFMCKHRIESASVVYRKELEEVKYAHFNPMAHHKRAVSRSASALLSQKNLPMKRRQELLQFVGRHFNETDADKVTHDMLVEASRWKPMTCELLMEKLGETPQELYDFIVGWKQHFVDTLQPKNLKHHWMEDTNQELRDILFL